MLFSTPLAMARSKKKFYFDNFLSFTLKNNLENCLFSVLQFQNHAISSKNIFFFFLVADIATVVQINNLFGFYFSNG